VESFFNVLDVVDRAIFDRSVARHLDKIRKK
jgi:hypothetical protein